MGRRVLDEGDTILNTVGRHGDENTIQKYVKGQGTEKEYKKIHSQQISLF